MEHGKTGELRTRGGLDDRHEPPVSADEPARYALTTSCAGVSGRVVCRAAYFVADEGGGIRHGAQAVPPRTHKTCRHCTPKLFGTPRMVIREAMAKGVRPYG